MRIVDHLSLPDAPRAYSLLPFWFWNDRLEPDELIRQINDFQNRGVYGFVIHPRVGLPRDCGWMSDRLLGFMRLAIEEAHKRDMTVLLYDEGMYPSGSASGQVVAADPTHACRCLAMDDADAALPDGHHVLLEKTIHKRRIRIVDRPVDSVIRGLHYIDDGPAEDEPAMADILNPDAVVSFIHLAYDRYYSEFGQYFGNTIRGVFTDEPSPLGRCREENVWPAQPTSSSISTVCTVKTSRRTCLRCGSMTFRTLSNTAPDTCKRSGCVWKKHGTCR